MMNQEQTAEPLLTRFVQDGDADVAVLFNVGMPNLRDDL